MDDSRIVVVMIYGDAFGFSRDQLDRIHQIVSGTPHIRVQEIRQEEMESEDVLKAEVIFGHPRVEMLKDALNLKWLHLPSAGANRYADKNLYAGEVILTNSSGTYGKPIAEHIIGMILAFNHNLHIYARKQPEKSWEKLRQVRDFFDSTICIIGMGDIGTEIAKKARALGAKVLGVKRTPGKKPEYLDGLYSPDDMDIALQQADYVTLALPDTPQTRGIISARRIEMMKPGVFIVNVGRGSAIDTDALIDALRSGHVAGAGLDVTDPEPLPKESPLWDMHNVIITPHVSGFSPTNPERIFNIFAENLKRYLRNEPLVNTVDFERGY